MSYPSPLLQRPGAVAAGDDEAGVAWHYGDPVREQRLLAAGEALVDLSGRGVVTVSGPDRLTWLDTLSSQWLRDLAPGRSAEALILSPHGHVENALHVLDDGETTWLTVEPGSQHSLLEHLQKMRFMLRVEISDVTDDWAVVAVQAGGAAEQRLRSVAEESGRVWTDPWPTTAVDSVPYSLVPDDEHPGWHRPWAEILLPRADLASSVGDRPLAGTWAAEALRVAAWRPRFGFETDHRTIPHELDWLRTAVHLHKGCYRGQETVARVHNLGKPPRRLVLLHLDGSSHRLPERGEEVRDDAGGRPIGRVTTPVRHHELGPIALAVVKRSLASDRPLLVGESPQTAIAATQEPIVMR